MRQANPPSAASARNAALAALFAMLAGCSSLDGHTLVSGQSTAADVETVMGAPRTKADAEGGDKIWFYPNGPMGQTTYAVRLGPDGRVRGVQQTLTRENVLKLKPGQMNKAAVESLLGPPGRVDRLERQQRDNWEYRLVDVNWKVLELGFSDDGVLRDMFYADDPAQKPEPDGHCVGC